LGKSAYDKSGKNATTTKHRHCSQQKAPKKMTAAMMTEKDAMRRNNSEATSSSSNSSVTSHHASEKSSQASSEEKGQTAIPSEEATQSAPQNATQGLFCPIPRSKSKSPHPKSLHSTRSRRSQAGADGYTHFTHDDDEEKGNDDAHPNDAEAEPYLVKWENGDADPLNPRSMTKLRRWAVVCIVSASSLCV
jgi:hypothetical protein